MKKKIQKILIYKIVIKTTFYVFFILKSNEEEQETKQFNMDMAVAEEYIEYYADKYNQLIRKHKFAFPICQHIDGNKLYNAIETTSKIPAGYYITPECIKDVEIFAKRILEKFGNKDGPFSKNKDVIEIFLHNLEHFLTDIYHTYFFID